MLLTPDAIINQRKIMKWYEYKSNFCDKAKLRKIRYIYYDNNEKDYVVIEKSKEKVLRNLFSSFNYFAYNKSQVTINGIKTDYIEKNAKKSFSDKECAYCFMNNNKYHYIAVINPNALLATFSSKHDVDIFFFQTDEKLDQHIEIMIMLNWKYLRKLK